MSVIARKWPLSGAVRAGGVAALWLVVAAPTAGNIGSCGLERADLDATKFFTEKRRIDCARCVSCALATAACDEACGASAVPSEFAEDCFPLTHDGEVCLAALTHASCEDYASYVADAGATVPTECNFCPPERKPAPEEP